MQNFPQDFIMDGRVLCPGLPDLLRKTILTFCEGSVKFQQTLEVIGSIHICSDSEKIATFLLDEQVTRPTSVGEDAHASDTASKVAANETFCSQNGGGGGGAKGGLDSQERGGGVKNGSSSNAGIMLPPKKSRKTLKPVRKINYRYMQSLESSDAESETEYITLDQNGRDCNGLQPGRDYIATRPLGMLEKRMREYLDNTDSNASHSSEETYKQNGGSNGGGGSDITKQESEAQTSPSGPPSYEVTSTRPDDVASMDQDMPESPSLSPHALKRESPNNLSLSPEAEVIADAPLQPPQAQVKQEMETGDTNNGAKYHQYDSAYARSYESALILSTLATAHNGPVFSLMDPKAFAGKPEQAYAMFANNNNNIDPSQKTVISNSSIFLPQQEQVFAEDLRSRKYASPEPATIFSGRGNSGSSTPVSGTGTGSALKETAGEDSWDKPVLCKICGKALKSEKMLDIHMNTAHTHKTIYPCKQCGKVFYAASSLHSHKKRTHTSMEQKYKCPHCDRFYAFQSELLRHIDTAHMELLSTNAGQVSIGSDVAAFWAAYREHPSMSVEALPALPLTVPQPQSQPALQPPSQQSPALQQQLPLMQPKSQSPTHLQSQSQSQLPPESVQPVLLQQQQQQLAAPNQTHHQNGLSNNGVPAPALPFTLLSQPEDLAKPRARSPAELEVLKNEVIHNNNNNTSNSNNNSNNNDSNSTTSEESAAATTTVPSAQGTRYKCNICSMLLKSKECLSLHINAKHTQKQAYPCTVCGKVFYAPSSRFCHIRRVHASTEQKFHCDYCDKIFTFHYELRNHLKLMHRHKLIQRSDGSVSETEPSAVENGDDVGGVGGLNDAQDLSNGSGMGTAACEELAVGSKAGSDQG